MTDYVVNPYINRAAVRRSDFYGRERELQEIYHSILASNASICTARGESESRQFSTRSYINATITMCPTIRGSVLLMSSRSSKQVWRSSSLSFCIRFSRRRASVNFRLISPHCERFDGTCGTDGNCNPTGGPPFVPFPADDVLVTKFNPSGSAVVYSTYLGGIKLRDVRLLLSI